MKISNWGNYPVIDAKVFSPKELPSGSFIARGLGRSYGDASLAPQIIDSRLSFSNEVELIDDLLIADAALSLKELLEHIVPKGYFLPVSPGTKYVTLGGAVAFDVHGKNHHIAGSFGRYCEWIEIENSNKQVIRCDRNNESRLFHETIGGMGLTGIIKKIALKLQSISSNQILQERISFNSLDEILNAFDVYSKKEYSVAWIDCLAKGASFGRSVLFVGEHAADGKLEVPKKAAINIPFNFPSFALNNLSIRLFNNLYYFKNRNYQKSKVDYDQFFYPLDSIHNWNRIYGKNGFTQYQFVVPFENGKEAIRQIIAKIQSRKIFPFLTVLKAFGKGNETSPLSFPMEGYTLALDFKISKQLFPFLDDLDKIVIQYGGRIYLAKDCRLNEKNFKSMYEMKDEIYGDPKCSSVLSSKNWTPMKALIIGANSDIAFELIKLWAAKGIELHLAARDTNSLKKKLEVNKIQASQVLTYHAEKQSDLDSLIKECPNPSILVLAHGVLGDNDASSIHQMDIVNFSSTAYLAKRYAENMLSIQDALIIGISSVAGLRGRASNYSYGANKAALNAYLSGLRNAYYSSGLRVCTVMPGPVQTKMIANENLKTKLISSPEKVAADIDRLLNNKKDVLYSPGYWRFIMFVIRSIPEFIFKRLKL